MGPKQQEMGMVVVVVGLVVLAAASPMAYGQLLPPLGPANITGAICCTPTGTCTPGSVPIPGVNVTLNCRTLLGRTVQVAQGVTNATGIFSIAVVNRVGSLAGIIPGTCLVTVKLPLSPIVCPLLSTVNGTITSVPTVVRSILDPLTGLVFTILRAITFLINVNVGA